MKPLRPFVLMFIAAVMCTMPLSGACPALRDTVNNTANPPQTVDDFVFQAEVMPTFEGGDLMKFRQWVIGELIYPPKAAVRNIQGDVIVAFTVERDGSLREIKVLSMPDELLGAEVVRVIRKSPSWSPGMTDGKAVRVRMSLPVTFRLAESSPTPQYEAKLASEPGVMRAAQEMPKFRGGSYLNFQPWARRNIRYPDEAREKNIRGRTVIAFIIEKDGSVKRTEILSSDHPSFSAEAERIVTTSDGWTPARHKGKRVAVCWVATLDFPSPEAQLQQAQLDGEPEILIDDDGDYSTYRLQMPQFDGGDFMNFRNWMLRHVEYPRLARERGIQGTVISKFIVEQDGSISSVVNIQSPHPELTREVNRLFRIAPKWTPGYKEVSLDDGEVKRIPIRVMFTIPFHFLMQ